MTFRPLPLLGNPHLQTILGNLWKGPPARLPVTRHLVPLADGDALAAHETTPLAWQPGSPIALLVHGLGGSHRSAMMQRLGNHFMDRGMRVVRMWICAAPAMELPWLGASTMPPARRRARGRRHDVPASAFLAALRDRFFSRRQCGAQPGGGRGTRPLANLRAVAALSPPVDLVLCSAMLATLPFYDHYYARNLRRQVRAHQACFPELPEVRFPKRLTMRLFDDLYTAPRGGFADATDYYRCASSLPNIPDIQVPTYILSVRDDPFIAVPPLEGLTGSANVEVQLVPKGGHLGFLGRDGVGGFRWGEKRVVDWIMGRVLDADRTPVAIAANP